MKRWFILLLFCFITNAVLANTIIKGVRIWPSPENTRVVFDLSGPLEYQQTEQGKAIVITLKKTSSCVDLSKINLLNTRIKQITSQQSNGNIQVCLQLEKPLKLNSFTLPPNQSYGHRLVVDLEVEEEVIPDQAERERILSLFKEEEYKVLPPMPVNPVSPIPVKTLAAKNTFIVAIDAGHGGEDPGAVGRCGTREKDVVLCISRYLKELIDKEPNMKAVLIRSGDYYVGLGQRVLRARKQKADLFVSIHADAVQDKRAEGASVFTLSERGASSAAARWLAERENRSDLVGGVSLKNKNKVLASVLLDLSQSASKEESHTAARHILRSLGKMASLHCGQVEKAGFAVLKAPDIPSLLVETGFISHPPTERKLRTPEYQRRIATSILHGIRQYASQKSHS